LGKKGSRREYVLQTALAERPPGMVDEVHWPKVMIVPLKKAAGCCSVT